ncbi:hypothetical protein GALMADRAFT_232450 [Galerina marginata CBS 339.88]|uniref:Uncharacterized protein n=1 Tax=Galerina marginata (strain CBS 339.88) TaxID=685588 RepID=A0A067SFU1_GALM3|nr:hypothetical protein GALMADRAFT_232450 [Galerina marginata CBS 339.88]
MPNFYLPPVDQDFYIPPEGLFFRLLGYYSSRVLVSRTHAQPEVFHHPRTETFEDQFFQLIHGTGKHAGYFAIKGKLTNKVLFSRNSSNPHVGHVDGNGAYDDNWFKLEIGTNTKASNFRLVNYNSDTVLVSRTHAEPQVYNHSKKETFDDQYFSFLFEDVEIDRVVYHVDKGEILSSTPLVIADQTLQNDTNTQQSMEFSINDTEVHTSTFDYTLGFTIAIGASITAGIPTVAEGQIKMDISNSHTFNWGGSTSTSKSYTARLPIVAPANSSVRATSSVTRSTLNIPFTVFSKAVSTGFVARTEGIYTGVTTWDLRHAVTKAGSPSSE